MIVLLIIGFPVLAVFIWGVVDGFKKVNYSPPQWEIEEDLTEINKAERMENYDRQIDGYTQLIKLLDNAFQYEHDTRKKASILAKQLTTLEKLNKTIEKREKLE